ncbi:sigma factor, partial [Sinorhizobium meliloti]
MTIEKKGDRFHMYLRHRRSLIDYAAPLLGSKDDAEDIVQDAYLRFVRETADEYGASIWMGRRDDQDDEIGGRDLAKMDCESVRCK